MNCQQIYRAAIVIALLSPLLMTGCKDKPEIKKTSGAKTKKPATIKPPETIEGTWLFSVVQRQPGQKTGEMISLGIPVALLKFEKNKEETKEKESTYNITVLDSTNFVGKRTLESSSVVGDKIRFKLVSDGQSGPMDYQATFHKEDKGVIRGSVMSESSGGQCIIGLLFYAPKATSLPKEIKQDILFKKEATLLNKQLQNVTTPALAYQTIEKNIKQNPKRAFSLFLCENNLFRMVIGLKYSEKQIDDYVKLYLKISETWGARYQEFARIQTASKLTRFSMAAPDYGYLASIAIKYFDEAEKELSEEGKKNWLNQIQAERNIALEEKSKYELKLKIDSLVEKLNNKDTKIAQEGATGLEKILAEHPYQITPLYQLADYFEKENKIDQAIEQNAKLVVIPLAQQQLARTWQYLKVKHDFPGEILTRLWKKKHGNTDQLEAYLDKAYDKMLAAVPGKKINRNIVIGGNHVVLCELFTGTKCPPCVAADVATSALEATFAPSDLIVLRYHQHVPGPDPLANEDAQIRFGYYGGSGTPTLCIDGQVTQPGGYMINAKDRYNELVKIIEPKLNQKTTIKIALTATGKGETLHVAAKVTGLINSPETLRLRLVLAEEKIPYLAANGIRKHEMIVRKMPGGIEGISAKDNVMEYSADISLAELKTELLEPLEALEERENKNFFPIKPMSLQKLRLVGFVQDDKDRTILQSAMIPVTGKLIYPKDDIAPETIPAPTIKPKETKPKTEKEPVKKPAAEKPKKKTETPSKVIPPKDPKKETKEKPKEKKETTSYFSSLQLQPVLFIEPDDEKPDEEKKEEIQRETISGNWTLDYFPERGIASPLALVEIKKSGDENFEVKPLDFPKQTGKLTLSNINLNKTDATFEADGMVGKFRFDGRLSNNKVIGLMQFKDGRVFPAMLHPCSKDQLDQVAKPKPEKNVIKLFATLRESEEEKAYQIFQQFVKDYPHSPLSMAIYSNILLAYVKDEGHSVEITSQLAKEYMKNAAYWGAAMEQSARLNIVDALLSQKFAPKLAKSYLDEAAKNFTKKSFMDWDLLIEPSRKQLELVTALIEIRSLEDKTEKKAFDFLTKTLTEKPFNAQIMWALAQYAEKKENNSEAMRLYAQLSSLPMLEMSLRREWAQENFAVQPTLPTDALERLWKQKFGDTELLERYKDSIYKKALKALTGKKYEPRKADAKNHVVLCELFTGSKCPPCVGADIATGALQQTFATTELVMLRYHQHIPGADPFANEQTANRFSYYNGRGTPSIYIDGKSFRGVGGYLEQAKSLYQRLVPVIEKELQIKSDTNITLSEKVADGHLNLTAKVTGLPKENSQLRLRLVLAEDEIHYHARNGIRVHEMVVRTMPGGVDGIKVKDGKLEFEQKLSLKEFKQDLLDELISFENENGLLFRAKPLKLEKMHIVAIVQNDKTGEVLQTAIIPIKEKLTYPTKKKKAAQKDSK